MCVCHVHCCRSSHHQTVAELASRPQNIDALQNAGVMAQLRPLLLDTVPSIQQSAALALGRLANHSEALAESVVKNEVLPQLVYSLTDENVRAIVDMPMISELAHSLCPDN
jgi:hypothetical protein